MKQRLGHPGSAKDVVVTGAAAGVGRANARASAARADRIGLIGRGEAGFAGARQDIGRGGERVIASAADVAGVDDIESAAKLWQKDRRRRGAPRGRHAQKR
jgi:NADP-dependent 3-hydroxy acid dehydrogenase YdfG